MASSPVISFVKGSDRDVIAPDTAQALRSSGALIIDERRTRTRYFDGRFLAAKDEIRDQNYFLTRLADLGRSGGTGVVGGLLVERGDATTVTIQPGQGVTPAGETVMIPNALTIPLADIAAVEQLDVTFGLSRAPRELARNRTGLYVLGLRPVEYTANPVASYPTTVNGPRSVQDGDIIEAAAVVLVPYVEQGAQGSADTRRSRVSRQVFVDHGALGIPENVLPLAMLAMDRGIVQWVDPYMVRREVGAEQGSVLGFGFSLHALRKAYALQYLHQLREILQERAGSNLAPRFAASEYFEALPPVGILPAAAIDPADFSQIYFPPQVQADISIIPSDELAVLIEESVLLPPINLTDTPDELESTSVLVLVSVPRTQLPQLQATLTTVTNSLRPAAPGLTFQRKPIQSLLGLTALRAAPPLVNTGSPIDAAWRTALGQNPLLWYVRRRNLTVREDVTGTRVVVSGDEIGVEKVLSTRLTQLGLANRFTALKAKASAPAIAQMTGMLASPAMSNPILSQSAIQELEQNPNIDQAAALKTSERFSDPQLGEGLAQLGQLNAAINQPAVVQALAASGVAPELDRVARSADPAVRTAVATKVIAIANSGAADAPARIATLVRDRPELNQ